MSEEGAGEGREEQRLLVDLEREEKEDEGRVDLQTQEEKKGMPKCFILSVK